MTSVTSWGHLFCHGSPSHPNNCGSLRVMGYHKSWEESFRRMFRYSSRTPRPYKPSTVLVLPCLRETGFHKHFTKQTSISSPSNPPAFSHVTTHMTRAIRQEGSIIMRNKINQCITFTFCLEIVQPNDFFILFFCRAADLLCFSK